MTLPVKSSISDKGLTSSTSSLSSLVSTTTENDLSTPIQSLTDSSMFHLTNSNDNAVKSRTGTLSSVAHHERSGSTIHDPEHQRRDSVSSSATTTNNANSNLTILSLSHADEKENRRLLDIQCKLKAKETGLHMVNKSICIELLFIRSFLFALALHQREISRSLAARHDCRDRTRRNAQHHHQRIARPRSNSRGTTLVRSLSDHHSSPLALE